jgi:hypothetical protein
MKHSMQSVEDYELYLYTLAEKFPSIHHSTLILVRRGASLARVAGEIHFEKDSSGVRYFVRSRIWYMHKIPDPQFTKDWGR